MWEFMASDSPTNKTKYEMGMDSTLKPVYEEHT